MQAPSHPLLHHATFGGTLATIILENSAVSTTHINGGCADRIEYIARPLVCAIMYPRYCFAVRVLSHIYNPSKPPFKCTRFFSLLRNSNCCLEVVQEAVRNFDMVSYHRGQIVRFALFFYGSGGIYVLGYMYISASILV